MRALGPALVFLLLSACGQRQVSATKRLAVLPFENLTADMRLDWLGTASAAALVSNLTGMPQLYPFRTDSVRGAYSARASEVLETHFESQGGRLSIHASLESLANRRILRQFLLEGPLSEGIIPLVNQLAKQVDPGARTFSTRDPAAFGSFGQALSTTDPAAQARLLQVATVQDPNFTASYLDWTQVLLAGGLRPEAEQAAASGQQHARNALDRAQLDYFATVARGTIKGRENTLLSLSKLTPSDPDVFRNLAQLHLLERKYGEAVRDYQSAVQADSTDPATYNVLGYAQSYTGDLEGARRTLTTYQKLAPDGDVNALDSLGEVSYFLGDFSAAERYFLEAYRGNPGLRLGFELMKAAQARLMSGDLKTADSLFKRYIDQTKMPEGALKGYQLGQWEWLTGRRKQALGRLQALLPTTQSGTAGSDTAALLGSQLAIWNLQTGNRAEAGRLAQSAAMQARTPGAQNIAALCRFISAATVQHSGNHIADSYALLFAGRFAEAIAPLEALYRETPPDSDAQVRTLLAWAYTKAGRAKDATGLTRIYPLPLTGNESLFASLAFPRFLQIRAGVLESQGKHADAERLTRLYQEYSGDLPDKL